MDELVEEHVLGWKTTKELVEANVEYRDIDRFQIVIFLPSKTGPKWPKDGFRSLRIHVVIR